MSHKDLDILTLTIVILDYLVLHTMEQWNSLWNLIIEIFYGSFYGSMPVVDTDGQSPTKPYQPKLSLILNFMIQMGSWSTQTGWHQIVY